MKKIITLFLFIACCSTFAFSQVSWVGNSYMFITKGGESTWYTGTNNYLQPGGYFHGADLGVFSDDFILGGQVQAYRESKEVAKMLYKINDGTIIDIPLPYRSTSGNNSKHEGSATISIAGLENGKYTIEVWFEHSNIYDNNEDQNYKATFTVLKIENDGDEYQIKVGETVIESGITDNTAISYSVECGETEYSLEKKQIGTENSYETVFTKSFTSKERGVDVNFDFNFSRETIALSSNYTMKYFFNDEVVGKNEDWLTVNNESVLKTITNNCDETIIIDDEIFSDFTGKAKIYLDQDENLVLYTPIFRVDYEAVKTSPSTWNTKNIFVQDNIDPTKFTAIIELEEELGEHRFWVSFNKGNGTSSADYQSGSSATVDLTTLDGLKSGMGSTTGTKIKLTAYSTNAEGNNDNWGVTGELYNEDATLQLAGSFDGWELENMEESSIEGVYTLTKVLDAGEYEFKVHKGGYLPYWWGNNRKFTVAEDETPVTFYAKQTDDNLNWYFYCDAQEFYLQRKSANNTGSGVKMTKSEDGTISYIGNLDNREEDYRIKTIDKSSSPINYDVMRDGIPVDGGNYKVTLNLADFTVTSTKLTLGGAFDSFIYNGVNPLESVFYNGNAASVDLSDFHENSFTINVGQAFHIGGEIWTWPLYSPNVNVQFAYMVNEGTPVYTDMQWIEDDSDNNKSKWQLEEGVNLICDLNVGYNTLDVWFMVTDEFTTIYNKHDDLTNFTARVSVVSSTVGVDDAESDDLRISVSNNHLNLKFEGMKKIELYTTAGQMVHTSNVCNQFDCTLNSGIYLLRINGDVHKVLIK